MEDLLDSHQRKWVSFIGIEQDNGMDIIKMYLKPGTPLHIAVSLGNLKTYGYACYTVINAPPQGTKERKKERKK